jgi:heme A synthase
MGSLILLGLLTAVSNISLIAIAYHSAFIHITFISVYCAILVSLTSTGRTDGPN